MLLGASVYGLGNLLAPFARVACRTADEGCSPADQIATVGGVLDVVITIPGILFFIISVFVLSGAMARITEWHDMAGPTRQLGIVFIALLVATAVASLIDATGLMNRVLASFGAAGIAGLAWHIAPSSPVSSTAG